MASELFQGVVSGDFRSILRAFQQISLLFQWFYGGFRNIARDLKGLRRFREYQFRGFPWVSRAFQEASGDFRRVLGVFRGISNMFHAGFKVVVMLRALERL